MAIVESRIREELVYAAGTTLKDAVRQVERGNSWSTAQEAYDAIGYWDEQENDYDVYLFTTVTCINRVCPPYTKR